MEQVLAGFERYLKEERRAQKNTVESYLRDVSGFLHWANMAADKLPDVGSELVQRYLDQLSAQGRSQASVRRAKASLRCFFGFLRQEGESNPAIGAHVPAGEKRSPEVLTQDEVERLLAAPDIGTAKGLRDRCMLDLLYATGLKVGELVALDVEDVGILAGYIRCSGPKGVRFVPVHAQATRRLEDYLACREAPGDQPALFVNARGGRMTRQGFWKLLKAYAAKARVKKTITPQTLRYTLALHMLENGADRQAIQAILGYADISSLQVFLSVFQGDLQAQYQKYHPKSAGR